MNSVTWSDLCHVDDLAVLQRDLGRLGEAAVQTLAALPESLPLPTALALTRASRNAPHAILQYL